MSEQEKKNTGHSASEWRHLYFTGISRVPPQDISLSIEQMQALLSMVNAPAAISCPRAIDPQYLINEKGTTPWLALYALLATRDPQALTAVAEGQSAIQVPAEFLAGTFHSHVNWPAEMLARYDLNLDGFYLFAIPFLLHRDAPAVTDLSQSAKSPDGQLEIFNIQEFRDEFPEQCLLEFGMLVKFIQSKRPDIVAAQPS